MDHGQQSDSTSVTKTRVKREQRSQRGFGQYFVISCASCLHRRSRLAGNDYRAMWRADLWRVWALSAFRRKARRLPEIPIRCPHLICSAALPFSLSLAIPRQDTPARPLSTLGDSSGSSGFPSPLSPPSSPNSEESSSSIIYRNYCYSNPNHQVIAAIRDSYPVRDLCVYGPLDSLVHHGPFPSASPVTLTSATVLSWQL